MPASRARYYVKAICIALGILADGTKEIPGIRIEQTEGAKFWLRVMNELKSRGVADILIAVVDWLPRSHQSPRMPHQSAGSNI